MIVDGTDCPIDTPFASKEERLRFYCGRNKDNTNSRYNLKYTIGVQVATGRIVAVLGPEPGSVHDITALRNSELIAIILSWDPYEVVLADKGYIGEPIFLTPYKATGGLSTQLTAFNEVLSSVRQIVECTIHRVKIFGVLGRCGRFRCSREQHKPVFNVCAQITNISLERSPVWMSENWYLTQ